ncbi:MAG: DNRLRE domain-containing protein [Spirochaetota bacterium]
MVSLATAGIALLLAGCAPPPTSVDLRSTAALDGEVTSAGGVITSSDEANVGDNQSNQSSRAFFSFDVSAIAPSETEDFDVTSARLRLTMMDWFSIDAALDPTVDLGNVVVELVDYGTSLNGADYSLPAIGDAVTLATNARMTTTYEADVTQLIVDYIDSGNPTSLGRRQFRLRHETETDGDDSTDETEWATQENHEDYAPVLTVTYNE